MIEETIQMTEDLTERKDIMIDGRMIADMLEMTDTKMIKETAEMIEKIQNVNELLDVLYTKYTMISAPIKDVIIVTSVTKGSSINCPVGITA